MRALGSSLAGVPDGSTAVAYPGKKTVLSVRFYIKMIVLPRQARDRHRQSTRNRVHRCLAVFTGTALSDAYAKENMGQFGMAFTPLRDIRVTALARFRAAGPSGVHQLAIHCAAHNRTQPDPRCHAKPEGSTIWQVRKRRSFAPFYTKTDHFTKTGSGQT
jgi:hypothetical protein